MSFLNVILGPRYTYIRGGHLEYGMSLLLLLWKEKFEGVVPVVEEWHIDVVVATGEV